MGRRRTRLSEAERSALRLFLKILVNAGSYGLFVEVNPEHGGKDPKTGGPKRTRVRVWAGDSSFETTSEITERPGPWYCPLLASLITAGGRLLLGTVERQVADAGSSYPRSMKPNTRVWLAVCVGVVLALSATGVLGWTAGAVVALALLLEVRTFWRALTTR